jgi:hypothetical protein
MDPDNAVVRLCAQGMEAEEKGNVEVAATLFARAWKQSANEFERCIAAHYVARHQPSAELALHWNQEALDCAHQVTDGSAAEFLASLYLNLGKSHEDLGNADRARQLYRDGAGTIALLPAGAYRDLVQDGIDRGLQRLDDTKASV